jgi:protein involved in polysaccharide export with SLBB domain
MCVNLKRHFALFVVLSFCAVSSASERQVTILGHVHKPGQYEIPDQDVRVLDAIAIADGTTSSKANEALIVRRQPGREEPAIISVNIDETKADGRKNLILAAGDAVSVEGPVPGESPVLFTRKTVTLFSTR